MKFLVAFVIVLLFVLWVLWPSCKRAAVHVGGQLPSITFWDGDTCTDAPVMDNGPKLQSGSAYNVPKKEQGLSGIVYGWPESFSVVNDPRANADPLLMGLNENDPDFWHSRESVGAYNSKYSKGNTRVYSQGGMGDIGSSAALRLSKGESFLSQPDEESFDSIKFVGNKLTNAKNNLVKLMK